MKLIAGLGNPGKEYENTRHNSGFLAMDKLCEKLNVECSTSKWNALIAKVNIEGQPVILMKPQTYMNESGNSVIQAVNFYHMNPEDVLVMHDDMDLAVGNVRIRNKGTSGGQKGMKSIIDQMKTDEIARIRIGVGHSTPGQHDLVPDWVLSPVPKAEQEIYQAALEDAAQAAYAWTYMPFDELMSKYNRKVKAEKKIEEQQ